MASKVQRIKAPVAILQLHIELRGTKPKVWRRVLVPETITLAKLHLVIQAAFGWSHCICTSSSLVMASAMARQIRCTTILARSPVRARD